MRARKFGAVTTLIAFGLFASCAHGGEELGPAGGKSGQGGSAGQLDAGKEGGKDGRAGGGTGGLSGSGGSEAGDEPAEASDTDAELDASVDATEDAPPDVGVPDVPVGSNEACPGQLIQLSGAAPNSLKGSVSGGTSPNDTGTSSCGVGGSRDAVYRFIAPVAGEVIVQLSTTAYDGVLYVRSTCPQASSERACANSAGTNGTESVRFIASKSVEYYVFADGASAGAAGLHAVDVELIPELPVDRCPGESVTWAGAPNDRTATLSGDTSKRLSDYTGSCASGSAQARDGVYQLNADTDGILTLDLNPTGFDGVLYVRSTCADAASELVCRNAAASGAAENVRMWATNGTNYFAFVDGAQNTQGGAYSVNARLSPQAPNEKCPGSAVSFSGSPNPGFTQAGDTTQRWDDFAPSCASTAAARDVVYSFTPTINGTLTLNLVPTGWDAVLAVRSSCSGSEVFCRNAAGSGGTESHSFIVSQGVTYYAIVDGASASAFGPFSLNGSLVPAKAAERCPGETLTLSGSPLAVTKNDNTTDYTADYTSSCAPGTSGQDAVYRIVAPQSGTLTVNLAPTGFDAALYVRTACDNTTTPLRCADVNGPGGDEIVSFPVTAGSEYFIFADAHTTGAGPFVLTARY